MRATRKEYYQAKCDVLQDINLLGCTGMADLFNGVSATRAIFAPHDKSWLEMQGKSPFSTAKSHLAQMQEHLDLIRLRRAGM